MLASPSRNIQQFAEEPFSILPDDFFEYFLLQVFSRLQIYDLEVCKIVCKKWNLIHYKAIKNLRITDRIIQDELSDLSYSIGLQKLSNLSSITINNYHKDSIFALMQILSSSHVSLKEFDCSFSFSLESMHYDSIFKMLSSNLHIEKLALGFYDPIESIDISNLCNLKCLSIHAQLVREDSLVLTAQQMENLEDFIYANAESGVCLERLFSFENLQNWKNLKKLCLNYRQSDSNLLKNCLHSFPSLKFLKLDVPFGSKPVNYLDLDLMPDLTELIIRPFNLEIFPMWLIHLKNLTSLDLQKVKDIDFIHALTNLIKLKHLKLSIVNRNERERKNGEKIQWIQDMLHLKSLHLACLGFDVILPSIHNLLSLEELNLHVYTARIVRIESLPLLPSLHSLHFEFESIETVYVDLNWSMYMKLDKFSLVSSYLPGFIYKNVEISSPNVSNLTSLTLKFNESQDISMHLVGHFTQLKYLELSHSRVEELPTSFHRLIHLLTFKLSWFGRLNSLSFLHNCPLLRILSISVAPSLSFISESFFDLKFVHEIKLDWCLKLSSYEKKLMKMALYYENTRTMVSALEIRNKFLND